MEDDEWSTTTMSTTTTADPIDLASEEFADLAVEEMEQTSRREFRFTAKGQEFTARILGFGSSFSETGKHNNHMPGTPPIDRCPACRWADVAILRMDEPGGYTEDRIAEPATRMYVVALMGKSVVPGEEDRVNTVWTPEAAEVLRSVAVRGKDGAPTKIPIPNARAFRYAAFADGAIREVLDEHDDMIPNVSSGRSDLVF